MSQATIRSQIKDLKRRIAGSTTGLEHLDIVEKGLLHDDVGVRHDAAGILINMSGEYPDQLRNLVPQISSRLDDEDASVRAQAIAIVYNLARWYPQAFGHTTELLQHSVRNGATEEERAIAVGALSRIALHRPDLITSQATSGEAIHESLTRYMDGPDSRNHLNEVNVDPDRVQDALSVLSGGDMSSRQLESDLSPVPLSTGLSKPARVGFKWIFRGFILPLFSLIALLNALRFSYRFRHRTMAGRARILFTQLRKWKFLVNGNRRTLYLRASMWPTATQIFPFLPGRAPVEADRRQQTGPLPDDWHIRAGFVRERDGYYCRNCGAGGGPNGNAELHVDHQIPRSVGGGNEPENLRTLCRDCHEARHARLFAS